MPFSIVKVRSSLNYSIIGLIIKHIRVGIIDKMKEIQLKYIEIYCLKVIISTVSGIVFLILRDTSNVADIRFTETCNATGPCVTGNQLLSIKL